MVNSAGFGFFLSGFLRFDFHEIHELFMRFNKNDLQGIIATHHSLARSRAAISSMWHPLSSNRSILNSLFIDTLHCTHIMWCKHCLLTHTNHFLLLLPLLLLLFTCQSRFQEFDFINRCANVQHVMRSMESSGSDCGSKLIHIFNAICFRIFRLIYNNRQ